MNKPTLVLAGSPANTLKEVYLKFARRAKKSLFIAAGLVAMAVMSVTVNAATFTVTSIADSGAGTLRQAIVDANATTGHDTINFAFNHPATILLTSTELVITNPVAINGNTIHPITIDGNDSHRVFNIQATTILNYLNITRGRTIPNVGTQDGAAIRSTSQLFINNCAIYANFANGGMGGAVYFTTELYVERSTISGNNATGNGGGITAGSNTALAWLIDSTVAFNVAGVGGGGVHNQNAIYNVRNSMISGNSASGGQDFMGNLSSHGHNLIGNSSGTTIVNIHSSDMQNVNPILQSLALNGGATRTHAVPRNSAAVDRGDNARNGLLDQRGTVRGTDGDRNGVRSVDIGAYELQVTPYDYDGGKQSDIGVARNFCGNSSLGPDPEGCTPQKRWYTLAPNGGATQATFGLPNDIIVPGDYDGDTIADIAVWRPSDGKFYLQQSTAGFGAFHWGMFGDIPVPAEYSANGITDFAVFREGVFHIFSHIQGYYTQTVGTAQDRPAVADYDGDSRTDPAVFKNGVWKILKSTTGLETTVVFGTTNDIAVPGDYDGDGKANVAVYRPSNGTWYVLAENGNFTGQQFGISSDSPVPADYDGDGKTDFAVYRNGTWHILNSRVGYSSVAFGLTSDTIIPGAYTARPLL